MLTAETLRELLDYDPETGVFTWRVYRSSNAQKGQRAGGLRKGNYWVIHIAGRGYPAHRLAWLYVHGRWPKDQIDHKNCVRTDNRITNLREATSSQNKHNRGPSRNNTSGFKGVTLHKASGLWHARIMKNRRYFSLGYFSNPAEAGAAYAKAAVEYHGEFARID